MILDFANFISWKWVYSLIDEITPDLTWKNAFRYIIITILKLTFIILYTLIDNSRYRIYLFKLRRISFLSWTREKWVISVISLLFQHWWSFNFLKDGNLFWHCSQRRLIFSCLLKCDEADFPSWNSNRCPPSAQTWQNPLCNWISFVFGRGVCKI